MHCSISHCRAKEKALVATTTYIYELISSITIHFYFLLCSFNSYLKTISSSQSSTNFCTDNMDGSFVDAKTALDSVKSSSWKFFNFRVAGGYVDRSYVHCKLYTTPLGDIQHIPNPPIAASEIYRQYIGTCYKYIFLKYIGNISGLAALARHSLGR